MRRLLVVSCLLLVVCYGAGAVVDIGEIGVGARPLAMGKAFVAGMDDATAIFTNPASLALNPYFNLTSMSGTLFNDVNYLLFGVSEQSPLGKLGIGYLSASVGGIPVTAISGSGSTETIVQTGTTDYLSNVIFLSYGTKLSRFLKGRKGENVALGGNVKIYSQGFSGGGSALQDAIGAGIDADLGLLWETSRWARVGLTLNNFLPLGFGGKFVWQKGNAVESIPMAVRVGGEFKLLGASAIWPDEEQTLTLLLDYEVGRGSNRIANWHVGTEYYPLEMIALRVGVDQKTSATETGTGIDNNLTAGVGFKLGGVTFDYAYHQFGELTQNTTHFFSIGFRGKDIPRKYRKDESTKKGILPLAEVVPKPKLENFSDVSEDYWARKPIQYLAALGIMTGYPDATFRPDQPLTRGELAVILVKAKGFEIKGKGENMFRDVKSKDLAAPYIEMAVRRKYMDGYSDATFRPHQKVSRAEAAVIFSKFSGLYVKPKVEEKVFSDLDKDHWASPAVAASKESGFFEFLAGDKFAPDKLLTRSDCAEILSKTSFVKEKIKNFIAGEK